MLKNWKKILLPISLLYSAILHVRHWLYDKKILPSNEFDIPIIKVGNLNLGGTGKTPHTEYIISILLREYNVAMLSRGYGRKSKGYQVASDSSCPDDIGDEALQIFKKFDGLTVIVDANRSRAVDLISQTDIEVIVMDDALQHRKLASGIQLLLMDFYRPIDNDYLIPAGHLRDIRSRSAKMDIVIITKCPYDLTKAEQLQYTNRLSPNPRQEIFFSTYKYLDITSVFGKHHTSSKHFDNIMLFSGIAKVSSLSEQVNTMSNNVIHKSFPDHHNYSEKDLSKLKELFDNFAEGDNILLTTEKDAIKLANMSIPEEIKELPIYYLPIKVDFLKRGEDFALLINEYVRKNKRNN